jgi:hypothetical protein
MAVVATAAAVTAAPVVGGTSAAARARMDSPHRVDAPAGRRVATRGVMGGAIVLTRRMVPLVVALVMAPFVMAPLVMAPLVMVAFVVVAGLVVMAFVVPPVVAATFVVAAVVVTAVVDAVDAVVNAVVAVVPAPNDAGGTDTDRLNHVVHGERPNPPRPHVAVPAALHLNVETDGEMRRRRSGQGTVEITASPLEDDDAMDRGGHDGHLREGHDRRRQGVAVGVGDPRVDLAIWCGHDFDVVVTHNGDLRLVDGDLRLRRGRPKPKAPQEGQAQRIMPTLHHAYSSPQQGEAGSRTSKVRATR